MRPKFLEKTPKIPAHAYLTQPATDCGAGHVNTDRTLGVRKQWLVKAGWPDHRCGTPEFEYQLNLAARQGVSSSPALPRKRREGRLRPIKALPPTPHLLEDRVHEDQVERQEVFTVEFVDAANIYRASAVLAETDRLNRIRETTILGDADSAGKIAWQNHQIDIPGETRKPM